MKNLKVTFMLALLFLLVTGIEAQTVTPSKKYITKEVKNASNFRSIKVLGSPGVEYRQSNNSKTEVSIYGSDNLVDLLEVSTTNGVLLVNIKKGVNIITGGEYRLKVVASSPLLNQVEIKGSGDVSLKGIVKGTDIQLNVIGSGDIESDNLQYTSISSLVKGSGDISLKKVKSATVNADVNGSGDINIEGTTRAATLAINGSGDINAEKLVATVVTATVAGSGDIVCSPTQVLNGKVNGSGDIEYKGNPTTVNKLGKKDQISGN